MRESNSEPEVEPEAAGTQPSDPNAGRLEGARTRRADEVGASEPVRNPAQPNRTQSMPSQTPEEVAERIPRLAASAKGILSLAIPALGALVIEPLLILIDSVMVGHLGTVPLAALSLASTILTTLVGVFVFLAYSTTAVTARALGSGRPADGIRGGVEAMWLGAGLGIALTTGLVVGAPALVRWMGAEGAVAADAATYLRAASFGMIGMLIILAATGTLRGLLDMKTPLYVLAIGSAINVVLNAILIYGLGLGILGAGIGLSITQTLMAVMLVTQVGRGARERNVSLLPSGTGVLSAASEGLPLFIRTLSLRAALLATVAVATAGGTLVLAGHQVVNSIWMIAAFALDALAIAAQSMVGVALGARNRSRETDEGSTGRSNTDLQKLNPDLQGDDQDTVTELRADGDVEVGAEAQLHALVRRLTIWGIGAAAAIGLVVAATSTWVPWLFGSDPEMHLVASHALLVAGLFMPISGVVFILDGVLIGASEGKYLAKLGVVTLVLYLPALGVLMHWINLNQPLGAAEQATALGWLWVAFAGWFMLLRAAANAARAFSPRLGTAATRAAAGRGSS